VLQAQFYSSIEDATTQYEQNENLFQKGYRQVIDSGHRLEQLHCYQVCHCLFKLRVATKWEWPLLFSVLSVTDY